MLPGGRHVKFTPKFVRPNWFPRGCLVRPFMSEARGSGNVNIGARAGADTASMAAAEKSLGIVTPKPIGCAKSVYSQTHFDPVRWLHGFGRQEPVGPPPASNESSRLKAPF